jgi:hypothetical protein
MVAPEHRTQAEAVLEELPFEPNRVHDRVDDTGERAKSRRWWFYYGILLAALILFTVILPRWLH